MTRYTAGGRWRIVFQTATILAAACGLGNAAQTEVDQIGQKFSLPGLSVPRGTTVRFLNRDDVTHNIHVIDSTDVAVDEGLQKPGQTITAQFDKSGRFLVRCSIHPRMKLAISVE